MSDADDRAEIAAKLARERDARQQLLRAQEVGKLGSWEVDLERESLSWSDMVFHIFELAREDFAGTEDAFFSLIHPDDRTAFLKAREAWLKEGGTFLYEHRIVTPKGRVKWVMERAEIITDADGCPLFTTGTVQDITDLKAAEAAREAAEQRLQDKTALITIAGEIGRIGGWRYDLESATLEWTDETARIHDEPSGYAPPTVEAALQYYAREDRPHVRALFDRCLHTGESFDATFRIITASGRKVTVRSVGVASRDAVGHIVAVQGAFQDITDIAAMQRRANDVEGQLNRTLETMSDGFLLLSRSWRMLYINQQGEQLLRRPRHELLGKSVWEEFPEAIGGVFDVEYSRALDTGESTEFEAFFEPFNSWFRVTAHPFQDGIAVYFRDVTAERHRIESLRLLNTAVAHLNDILLITEARPLNAPDGPRIVYVNDAFERRTGYSASEVIGQTPRILQGPETQREELDRIARSLQDGCPVRAELINYTKSGEPFWLELEIVPLTDADGELTHWVAVQRDITERKQTEQELLASEERFRLMAKATGTAIWEVNTADMAGWWSEGLTDVFGYPPDADRISPLDWRETIHPDDFSRVNDALSQLLAGEKAYVHEHYRFRRGDGTWADVESRALAINDGGNRVARILGSLTDVSQRLALEHQLRQTQKMSALGEMTGGIAHDFNNILTVIMGSSDQLAEEVGRELADRQDLVDLSQQVMKAAQRGAELTARLLAFARKQVLQPVVMDLNATMRSMVSMLQRSLGETVEIGVSWATDLAPVEVDPAQLESALLNLAINARDAMPSGGKLTLETHDTWIDAEAANSLGIAEGRYSVVAVSDTGGGIAERDIERVLEPFFTTKESGTGLGLPMVFGFVKQSGGHIKIYSELSEGTTVKLYFPVATQEPDSALRTSLNTRTPRGRGELVLVVEDDPLVRQNAVAMVSRLNYRVIEAENAASALDIIERQGDIALLFTDVVMPGGMNGRELADLALQRRPDLRVLYTSGYTENAIVHQGRLDPGVDLLSKPYRLQELALKLRSVLDQPPTTS
jgi:PAS domain S-box-containing protein